MPHDASRERPSAKERGTVARSIYCMYLSLTPAESLHSPGLQALDGNRKKDTPGIANHHVEKARIAEGFPILRLDGRNPSVAEQYRTLRTNILQKAPNCSVLAITSPVPGDGKTVTTFNLAAVFALRSEARILVIDADMRKRGLSNALGLEGKVGLADVLKQTHDVGDAIVRMDALSNLYILPAGVPSVHPAELLDSPVFSTVVANLRRRFSHIFVDTTPMQLMTDFKLVQKVCEGVILVVRPDHTDRAALWALKGSDLEELIGTVLNGVEDWFLWRTQES